MSGEMDNDRLVNLRRHQFILSNLTMMIILIVFLTFAMLDITLKQLYFGTATLFLIQLLIYLKYGRTDLFVHTKKMKELHEYEKKKLGKEERKQRQLVIGSLLLSIILTLLMSLSMSSEQPIFYTLAFSSAPELIVSCIVIVMVILMNVIIFFRNREFDRSKNLEGFTMKMFLFGLFISFVMFGIIGTCYILLFV